MKYRCLILDHDDTVVNSTATVHYPSFVEFMDRYFGGTQYTLEDYFTYNFDPGVLAFFHEMIGLSDAEMKAEEQFWRDYVEDHIPPVFPGIRALLWDYKEAGGIIAVISHSYGDYIRRDYRADGLPEPDFVHGWEVPLERRKPLPDSVFEILDRFSLRPEEVLVVDDLKPGCDMAKAAGVPFAAAGWAHSIPAIEQVMRRETPLYFKTVEALREHLEID